MAAQARIAITGGPGTGKTTLARSMSAIPLHTDDLIEFGWSTASAMAALWFDHPGGLVIEGVAVPRALRKWLAANPEGQPVNTLIYLTEPFIEQTAGQRAMAKGVATVLEEIRGDLESRGVIIDTR